MVIKTTRWSPDTCGCVFDYEWDDAQSEDTRTHNFKTVVTECASHSNLTGNNKKDMFDSSLEENTRKNGTIGELLARAGVDFADIQQDGSFQWKNGINVSWTWSGTAPNRVMTLTVTGKTLTQQRKNQIQGFLDARFGNGKVVFVNN